MKVAELIAKLQAFPPELEVVQSKDGEGNDFSPTADVVGGVYASENTWSGEFTDVEEDAVEMTERGGIAAVCLWPTN